MRLTSTGLGIGTTTPGSALDVAGEIRIYPASGAGNLRFGSGGVEKGKIAIDSSSNCIIETANNERVRIDSSGRLLVGTSTAQGDATLQIQGDATGSTASGKIFLRRGLSASTIGANIGADLGYIDFGGNDNSVGARIAALSDATWGSSDYPSRLVFSTTADGASSPTERMRITSGGTVAVGVTNPTLSFADGTGIELGAGGYLSSNRTSNPSGAFARNTTTGDVVLFSYGSTATNPGQVGSISVTASATAYNTSSDYRLKENVVPLTGAIDRVNQLKPSQFNFIADPSTTVDGFIAHEAQAVVPECVTGTKDEVNADGNPVYQGIDQSKLVPLLTAALQEALRKIEGLEARLTAAGL
jgi:hypothetical protein